MDEVYIICNRVADGPSYVESDVVTCVDCRAECWVSRRSSMPLLTSGRAAGVKCVECALTGPPPTAVIITPETDAETRDFQRRGMN